MENKKEAGMTLIVKTTTRLTVGLVLLYGIYIVLRGHAGPGGGFAGGVIIALSFIQLMLAYGKDAVLDKLNEARGILLAGLGAMVLLAAVLFISYSGASACGVILLSDIAAACLVSAGLFTIFLVLVLSTGSQDEK